VDKQNHIDSQEAALGSWRMPHLDQALVAILEQSLFADSSRAQAQVAEQYENIQALGLGRGADLILDLAPARPNRLRPRRVEKQLVVRPRDATELFVKDREAMTRHPNHRASKAREIRIAARILLERPARRQTIEM
jgi:hypothetical protein